MRVKEKERQLRRALRYHRLWFESGLLSGELLEFQSCYLRKKVGHRSRPLPSAEHWRYAAFIWCLRRVQNLEQLMVLLRVAAEERDEPMGASVVKKIALHPMASDEVKRLCSKLMLS